LCLIACWTHLITERHSSMAAKSVAHTAGLATDLAKLKAKAWWGDMKEKLVARQSRRQGKQYAYDETLTMLLIVKSAKVHISTDSNDLSDPFVKILDAEGEKLGKTKTMKNTLEPNWNENFYIKVLPNDPIIFLLYDHDAIGKNDYLGCASIVAECQISIGVPPKLLPQDDVVVAVMKKKVNKDGTETDVHYADITFSLRISGNSTH
jgi:hypothetical protein